MNKESFIEHFECEQCKSDSFVFHHLDYLDVQILNTTILRGIDSDIIGGEHNYYWGVRCTCNRCSEEQYIFHYKVNGKDKTSVFKLNNVQEKEGEL